MGSAGNFDFSGIKKFQKKLEKMKGNDYNDFVNGCAKELAARLLAAVVKKTPVGNYGKEIEVTAKRDSKHHKKGDVYKKRVNKTGRVGGTLQRGWTAKTHEEAENGNGRPSADEVKAFVNELNVKHSGNMFEIEMVNPVEYALYVEYGHRKGHGGWVQGKFMLTVSEKEIQEMAPAILEAKLKKFLTECMKND